MYQATGKLCRSLNLEKCLEWSVSELNRPHDACKALSPPWYMTPHVRLSFLVSCLLNDTSHSRDATGLEPIYQE